MTNTTTKNATHPLSIMKRLTVVAMFFALNFIGSTTRAQLLYTETFDIATASPSLPLGWSQGKFGAGTDTDNYWDRVTAGVNAPAAPHGGTAMMRYFSDQTTAGEASFLASKKFAMNGIGAQAMPAGGANFSFWFFRDGLVLGSNDRIQVYVNDSAVVTLGATGATLLNETVSTQSAINRPNTLTPASAAGWQQYSYNIPNVAPYNGSSVYVMILAISANGNDMYVDDFSITSYPKLQVYVGSSAQVVSQNTATTAPNNVNQEIISMKLTMDGGVTPKVLSNMQFNTNGSTSPTTDISAAKLYFTGGNSIFDPATAVLLGTYTNPWATNYTFLTAPSGNYTGMLNFSALEHGDNYFWLQYNIPAGAVSGNVVDAEWVDFMLPSPSAIVPSVQNWPGNRLIDLIYCIPTYSTGTSWQQYNTNDFINRVICAGAAIPPPGIDNQWNIIQAACGSSAASGCSVGPFPKNCPFQKHGPDYELHAAVAGKTTSFIANGTTAYPISLQVGTYGSGNSIAAFIDFNHDGDFVDAGEKIAQSGALGALGTYTVSFTVPVSAVSGKTRMRVREVWIDYNIQPCNNKTYGETEDYEITIVPDCPGYPGYTTWLGLTSNWADPSNWCPSIAPLAVNPAVNVRIPGGPSGAYPYKRPIITAGVAAKANKLRIEANDTLYVDATSNSSLLVQDSMKIWTPTSALLVNTTHIDTAQVMNGTLNRPTDNPLTNSRRSRSFLAFTQADLQAQGLVTGDVITNILIHMQRKSNGNPYKNLEVKYYYANVAPFGNGATAVIPVPIGPPASPVTIFVGDLDVDSYIPVVNDFGTVNLALLTPFAWTGTANNLIIEICYDNTGFASTGVTDEIRFTQTTSLRRYLNIEELSSFPKAGCSLTPQDTVWVSISGAGGGTNQVTITDPAAASKIWPGQLIIGPLPIAGQQVVSIAGTTITLSGTHAAAFASTQMNFFNTNTIGIFYRPNLTFKYSRPYIKYPITVGGHWENNGTFNAAVSRVTLNGTGVNQKIDGLSSTTFYDLDINNINNVMRYRDFTVQDSLKLINGRLKMNNGMMTLANPALSAITRNSGYIQAETDAIGSNAFPFGRVRWQMGSVAGLRIIPFVSSGGVPIPFDYNVNSGTHDVIIGTFNTLPNNTNLPLPEVTNVFGYATTAGWGSSGDAVVDRFYHVKDTLGVAPQADLTFRYANSERAVTNLSGATAMNAQRWINATDLWEFPFYGVQNYVQGNPDYVQVQNFTGFNDNTWWTIVGQNNPLPVSMLDFTAEKQKDRVRLAWTTATEINNSHFEIERTTDNKNFELIGRVESLGSGTNLQSYYLYDNSPLQGIQYYYLRQYDYDGKMESFGPVSAKFSKDVFEIVSTTAATSDKGVTVIFNYNSQEPYSYRIMDMTGRIVVSSDRNAATEGMNVIEIDASLAKGAYHIVLQNSTDMVSKKFFY